MNERRRRRNYCSFRQLKKVQMAEAESCKRCRASAEQINLSLSSATSSISVSAGRAWGPHPGALMDTRGWIPAARRGSRCRTAPKERGLSTAPPPCQRGSAFGKGSPACLQSPAQPRPGCLAQPAAGCARQSPLGNGPSLQTARCR